MLNDRYCDLIKIGSGGMATVYKAILKGPGNFKKQVAIKQIKKEYLANQQYSDLFIDEATLSAQLQHQNIVQIFDFFEAEETFNLVMEYLDGCSLDQLLLKNKTIPKAITLLIIRSILRGMAHYNGRKSDLGEPLNIIHRDLNPKNILFSKTGDVKIGDFGIATFSAQQHQTQFGELRGTPAYMSPEQIKLLGSLDIRSDLFSLGLIFYTLLTGEHPFPGENQFQVQEGILSQDPDYKNIDQKLRPIIKKLLQKDRKKRYHHPVSVLNDLNKLCLKIAPREQLARMILLLIDPEQKTLLATLDLEEITQKRSQYKIYPILVVILCAIIAGLILFPQKEIQTTVKTVTKKIFIQEKCPETKIKMATVKTVKPVKKVKKVKKKSLTTKKIKQNRHKRGKATLKPQKITPGYLTITLIPYGEIFLDGKKISDLSITNYQIKPGKHQLILSNKELNFHQEELIELHSGDLIKRHIKIPQR